MVSLSPSQRNRSAGRSVERNDRMAGAVRRDAFASIPVLPLIAQ